MARYGVGGELNTPPPESGSDRHFTSGQLTAALFAGMAVAVPLCALMYVVGERLNLGMPLGVSSLKPGKTYTVVTVSHDGPYYLITEPIGEDRFRTLFLGNVAGEQLKEGDRIRPHHDKLIIDHLK